MVYKCTIKCVECGHKTGLEERPTSDLDVDELSVGETITSVCFGDCDSARQEHTVVSKGE